MKRWQALLGSPAPRQEQRGTITFQDWANIVMDSQFATTTYSHIDEEELSRTASAAYRSNGPVFALVLLRLQVFSQARFQWARFDRGRPGDLFGTSELSVLERPWPGGTTADLLARMELGASYAGNAFIRRIRRPANQGGDRLAMLNPEWVTVMAGSHEGPDNPLEAADAEVIGYAYWPGGRVNGKPIILEPFEVAHYAPIPSPDARFLGMSWINPVLREVGGDDAATVHKQKFFQNAATPNLAIKFDPTVKLEQIKQFKELLEAEHKGAWNAYKTLYLGGGADPKVVGKDFRELDFATTQGKGESRLAAAAGVPPSLVGFSEGLQGSALNQGNFDAAARRRFGDGTMRHLWGNAAASLETILRVPAGASVHLTYDPRDIPFLREDVKAAAEVQQQEATTITTLVKEGFTAESVIQAVLSSDWTQLKHSGLLSVQLQPPGTTTDNPDAPPAPDTEE